MLMINDLSAEGRYFTQNNRRHVSDHALEIIETFPHIISSTGGVVIAETLYGRSIKAKQR